MIKSFDSSKINRRFSRTMILAASVLAILLLVGCGGTKVYNVDKTIVYQNSMYNVSDVKQIKANTTGKLSDDSIVSLRGADRKKIEALLKENGPMYVRMSFDMDGEEMLYRANTVERWSEFQSMQRSFEKAGKEVASLLAAKKTTQLKLR